MLYADTFHIEELSLSLKGVLYELVFPNGKVYVGQTTLLLKTRLRGHLNDLRRNSTNRKLYNAISFYKECGCIVIASGLSIAELNDLEQVKISELNSIKAGYNSVSGGKNASPSDEVREKIRLKKTGSTHSAETRAKMSLRQKDKKLSVDHRLKIGNGNKKRVINLDTGVVYNSCSEAAASLDGEQKHLASAMTQGVRFKGYKFCLLSQKDTVVFRNRRSRKIKNTDTGEEFNSIADAARSIGSVYETLAAAIRNNRKCKNYSFIYN